MLASTVQFSNNERSPSRDLGAYPLPTQGSWRFDRPTGPVMKQPPSRAVPSGPNSVPRRPPRHQRCAFHPEGVLTRCRPKKTAVVDVPPLSTTPNAYGSGLASARPHRSRACQMLLRKEVIQPHLPVRLPCYDLVPIASPTFDGSPSYELGHRLRVLPTFVT